SNRWRTWYRFPRCGSARSRRLAPVLPRAGRRGRAARHRRFRWRTRSAGRRSRYGPVDRPLDADIAHLIGPTKIPAADHLLTGSAPDSFATLGGSCLSVTSNFGTKPCFLRSLRMDAPSTCGEPPANDPRVRPDPLWGDRAAPV